MKQELNKRRMNMKLKRALAVTLITIMAAGTVACGETTASESGQETGAVAQAEDEQVAAADAPSSEAEGIKSYADLVLGEDFTDLNTEISFFSNRTDLDSEDYGGVTWKEYIEAFNVVYPDITVNVITDTNYAEDAKTHLQSGD
jgi:ABC-type glycerol-3-phosphate transport system substrate-binding protein